MQPLQNIASASLRFNHKWAYLKFDLMWACPTLTGGLHPAAHMYPDEPRREILRGTREEHVLVF